MFPYLQSEEIAPDYEYEDKFLDDLFKDCEALSADIEIKNEGAVKKRQRMSEHNIKCVGGTTSPKKDRTTGGDHQKARKSMHRDTERQRRKEMAGLYASLRSLLPLEYIKGKRAVTDQLNQAANYIKHTQHKIGKMQMRRRELEKQLSAGADEDHTNKPAGANNRVEVNPCRGGMEILITSDQASGALSKVLADLLRISDQLNVISCVSTRPGPGPDQLSLHRIQIEVNDSAGIDLSQLQKRLVNVIN